MSKVLLRLRLSIRLAIILSCACSSLSAQQPSPPDTSTSRVQLSIQQPPTERHNEWLTLLGNVAWPIVVVASVWMMRRPLGDFLTAIGNRATKLSVGGLALELPAATEPKGRLDVSLEEIRNPTTGSPVMDSSRALLADLASTEPADYVIVDIGNGTEWLTSRLFIVAQLFPRLRGVRVVVFLGSSSGGPPQFIGLIEASRLRWALAEQYPWLEWALMSAMSMSVVPAGVGAAIPTGPRITSRAGGLDQTIITMVVQNYLNAIQTTAVPNDLRTWVDLGGRWEHAEWINQQWFSRVLGRDLQSESFVQDSSVPTSEAAQRVLRIRGVDFAAAVTGGRFVKLVNRRKLLERLAERATD